MEKIGDHWYPCEDWEFGVLGLYNFRRPGPFSYLFDFARENSWREGDYIEAGVFRGRTLLSMGLFLRMIGSKSKVVGFDTFSGFPAVEAEEDKLAQFDVLHREGRISDEHLTSVYRNRDWLTHLSGKELSPRNISSSGDFSDSNLEILNAKKELLNLSNVEIIDGPFSETMTAENKLLDGRKFAFGLLDCDLYESYRTTLDFVWPRLESGGELFLDEYYSLKFPGARIACDEIASQADARLVMVSNHPGDFERWVLRKVSSGRE